MNKEKSEKEGLVSIFRFLIGNMEAKDRKSWMTLTALSLISTVTDTFSFSTVVFIISQLSREGSADSALFLFTLCMAGVSLLKCLFDLYRNKLANRVIYYGAQRLSEKVFEVLIKEDLRAHQQKDPMQALAMVRQDTVSCIQIISSSIDIFSNCLTLAGYAVILIYVSKWFGVAGSAALILLMAAVYFWTRDRIIAYGAKSRAYSIQANSQVTIAYGSFKEMKIDDRSAFVLSKYQQASTQYAQVESSFHFESSSVALVLQNFTICAMFAVLILIMLAGANLPVILVPMTAYITALFRMIPTVSSILIGLFRIEFSRRPYAKIKEIIAKYGAIKEKERQLAALRRKTPTFRQGLSIRNLTFAYNPHTKIFENASLDIPVGGSVAVIGVSGVGKTTFLDLILGLLKPQEGHVYFDDYDIVTQTDRDGPCQASLGALVSYIPQTIYLNGETIRRNVAFFSDDADIDDARVESCLRCAQIWEDVQKMPEGINTLIGENGTAISGGQRQRIALARALYKDFELLVMDEATAALDMETERAVIDSIRHIRSGKTLLIVTHHMSLANECDIIYKIENKKIVPVKGPQSKPPQ